MSLFRRIGSLGFGSKDEREIVDQLDAHIQMRTADNIAAGMPPREARRNALVRFGNPTVIEEQIVTLETGVGVEKLLRDFRYAL
jgi:hypothetical protein